MEKTFPACFFVWKILEFHLFFHLLYKIQRDKRSNKFNCKMQIDTRAKIKASFPRNQQKVTRKK